MIDRLNDTYGVEGRIVFVDGRGGLPAAQLTAAKGRCRVSIYGAHVLEFRPNGFDDLLWLSAESAYEPGAPIRGGIPVCWPWFGGSAPRPDLPSHGFARTQLWQVAETDITPRGECRLVMTLADTPETRAAWPHMFKSRVEITCGEHLNVALTTHNTDAHPFEWTGALHTYLSVGDIRQARLDGLSGATFIDTVGGRRQQKRQSGTITFMRETDAVFLDTTDVCTVTDPVLNRRIAVEKTGSLSTVVWNPWIAKAKAMPDYGAEEYKGMLCVETANALKNSVSVAPGQEHCMGLNLVAKAL